MNREEAIRKATALLRLARKAGTPGEAAAAAARAQAVMDRHQIEEALLDLDGRSDAPELITMEHDPIDNRARQEGWRGRLAFNIGHMNGCYVFHETLKYSDGPNRYCLRIVGRPSEVALVRNLFSYLSREIAKQANAWAPVYNAFRTAFCQGCVDTVLSRMHEERERTVAAARAQYAGDPRALVVIDKALVRTQDFEAGKAAAHESMKFRDPKKEKVPSFNGDDSWLGRAIGQQVGKTIPLHGEAAGVLSAPKKEIARG